MANITQDSLNIRLQKLICCIGTLGGEIQGMIAVGNDCYKEKLKKLKILVGYLEALECYSLDEPTLATGIIQFSGIQNTGTIEIFINSISITGILNLIDFSSDVTTFEQELVNVINSYQSTYIASWDIDTSITISGVCTNGEITIEILDSLTATTLVTGLTGGICIDNCLTEEQVLAMFDRVSRYCDICFPSAQYNFTDSLISTTPVE